MNQIFEQSLLLTQDSRDHIRESFLSVFVYMPIVMGGDFESHVYKVIETIVESISHDKEKIRNLAIKSMKILIQNFLQKNIEILITPFYEGAISENSTKRNSSLILLGDVLDILNEQLHDKEALYQNHQRLFSIFYIMKNDTVGEVRLTATNVFKTFVDNPTRCLKIIFGDLVTCFINLYLRENEHYDRIANSGLKEFAYKYGDMFILKIISNASFVKNQADSTYKRGVCIFFRYFITFFNQNYITTERKNALYELLYSLYNEEDENVWKQALKSIRTLVEKTGDVSYIKDILSSSLNGFESFDQSSILYDKLIHFFCEFLESHSQKVVSTVNEFIITPDFSEWQLEVIIKNSKLFGGFLYNSEELENGISLFLEALKVI